MPRAVYPWREHNQYTLLVDGNRFFPAMLECIEQARHAIAIELYLVEKGACATTLMEALIQAAQRGVAVHCLLDGFGTLRMDDTHRQRLEAAGGHVRRYNPVGLTHGWRNLYRDHRKLLVVDEQIAFVGGSGATNEFWAPGEEICQWHEVMVRITGPLVADWLSLFQRQWQATCSRRAWKPQASRGRVQLPTPPTATQGLGRVAYADARQHRDIVFSLVRALIGARERIWLATPYFLPSWRVRGALRKAAKRGVDVRLILTGRHTDNPPVRFAGQRYYPRLLKAGVRIFEYQPRFSHLKMVQVDDWVSVGSCNFDYWNLRFNLEANLEAIDPTLSRSVSECFLADFQESREITLQDWYRRPWWKRAREWLWGTLDRLVLTILGKRHS
ncbi:phosphatidylserine/phosphatidylglycerophosphate/cardiolipin synthase-like enzyme [Pseudomonas duriflava]|uniref:Phosphatidylserine/phosphatidylglycerophosphate/ cardiolipin synthase-like enzyme n=1 Tax=Pseudomonas duriflava TaxID=459528 RepID=A0A562QP40_9PSED|nr:phosphatidylserine/phosphatidylglycerophosphate/cardiolipin synthase family protein [Pseudomonas duriflava]TWI58519.1 phosphatidylserine/phosphatidylglycerophosphate/cardiolipin synthase-like enzyme [Pseudomonas duriflava]